MDAARPSPAGAAVLNEALERRLEALGDTELRQSALWRLEGYTNREIADTPDCTERSVERRLERFAGSGLCLRFVICRVSHFRVFVIFQEIKIHHEGANVRKREHEHNRVALSFVSRTRRWKHLTPIAFVAETEMNHWYVIVGGIVFVSMLVIPLRSRWYMGCGLALLGAILAGGIAFGAGWYYVNRYHVAPRPQHDMDFSGLETPLICLVVIPALSTLVGLVLGLGYAYFLVGSLPDKSSSKPDRSEY
jgi:hypothetical protein